MHHAIMSSTWHYNSYNIKIWNSIKSKSNNVVFRTELLKQVIMKTSQEVESKKVTQDNVWNVWSKVANAIFRDPQSSNSYGCTLLQNLHGAKHSEWSFGDQQFLAERHLRYRNTLGLVSNDPAYTATKRVLRCIVKQLLHNNDQYYNSVQPRKQNAYVTLNFIWRNCRFLYQKSAFC